MALLWGTLGTFIILVVAGITYGIILAVRDIMHNAAPVHTDIYNTTDANRTHVAIVTEKYTDKNGTFLRRIINLHKTNEITADTLSVSAFPHPIQDVPPQCADPTFACHDLEHARLCKVTRTCINDIWATMSAPNDNDDICDICKEMVKEARDQLLSNMTQEEIKEVFEGSCKLLPIKLVADACIKVVDEIIPELVEMLASRMDPTMVCTVSGLCNVLHPSLENHVFKLFKDALNLQKDSECGECKIIAADIKTFLKTTPESEVKTYVENICDHNLSKYLCDIIVNSYFTSIYNYVITADTDALCASAGICPKVCDPKGEHINDELTCEFCEHVLQHVKDLITANTTAEEFRTALLNFCKHVGSFSDKCTSLVNDYYDMVFDYIRKLDTKGMCTLIGLCNNDKCSKMPLIKLIPALEAQRHVPMIKLQPAQQIPNRDLFQPFIRLIPAELLNKKDMIEDNSIFPSQTPLQKVVHPFTIFKKDTECAFCKAISFYLMHDLKGDTSKEGIRNALDQVCDRWVKDFPTHCQEFVAKYAEKIQHGISKGVRFEDICTFTQTCDVEDKKSELNVKVVPKLKGQVCDLCKDVMQEIENQLKDPDTKNILHGLVNKACGLLPSSLKDDCKNFFNYNVDAIISILEKHLQPDSICPAIGVCPEMNVKVFLKLKDGPFCDLCKDAMQEIEDKLSDPATKNMIHNLADEACNVLPSSMRDDCKSFLNSNIDALIDILQQELQPNNFCPALGLCSASTRIQLPQRVKDMECDVCKDVVSSLQKKISDPDSKKIVLTLLEEACARLPGSVAQECKSFVDENIDTVISMLVQELNPDSVCSLFKFCPASIKVERPKKVKDLECELCKEVVQKVEDLIKDKKTEDEIKNALDEVCSYLPASLSKKCEDFVNTYTETLITLLSEELDPDMICSLLNVCPKKAHFHEWLSKAQDLECEGCQYALHYIQEQLSNPDSQAEVKNLMKRMCDVLPATLAKNCDAFVDEYGSALLVLVAQEIDPSKMCYQLQLCTNQTKIFENHAGILHPFNMDECSICTTVVDYVDKLLEEDDVDKEITRLVEKVCTVLPSSYMDKCSTILETYGPYILQMIGQVADSKEVCQEIDLCPRAAGHVHLLGGNKCTFGPSYWCRSSAHASACKAEMFCKEKVWKN